MSLQRAASRNRARHSDNPQSPNRPRPIARLRCQIGSRRERGADFHYTKGSWWRYDEAGGLWLNDDTLHVFTEIKRFNTRVAGEICDAAGGRGRKPPRKPRADLPAS